MASRAACRNLITSGGSSRTILSHHTSFPDLNSASSMGLSSSEAGSGRPQPGSARSEGAASGEGQHDWESGNTALGHHLVDFFTNICICQSLILESNASEEGGLPVYQVGGWFGGGGTGGLQGLRRARAGSAAGPRLAALRKSGC